MNWNFDLVGLLWPLIAPRITDFRSNLPSHILREIDPGFITAHFLTQASTEEIQHLFDNLGPFVYFKKRRKNLFNLKCFKKNHDKLTPKKKDHDN